MNIGERIAIIREKVNLNQESFGKRINVTRSAISNYEKGTRNIMDRVISDICREFNVNEEWLRNGTGEIFVEPDTFSLDEYVKKRGASEFELSIMKAYFEMPEELRNGLINHFKSKILPGLRGNDESVATKAETFEDHKTKELEAYALELDAEQKGEISSASEKQEGA